jgi:hypothetical protein
MTSVSKPWLYVLAALLGLSATSSSPAAAPPQPSYHRPCKADDLPGLWKVVHWSTYVDQSKLGTYDDPHQWYLFGADGALRSTTSSEPNESVADIKKSLETLPVVVRYMCPTAGTLETIRSDANGQSELWQAFYVTAQTADPAGKLDLRAGDIVMVLKDKDNRPAYVRQMRKVAE